MDKSRKARLAALEIDLPLLRSIKDNGKRRGSSNLSLQIEILCDEIKKSTQGQSPPMETLIKMERSVAAIKKRYKEEVLNPIESESCDTPLTTRHYDGTSTISTERSVDREQKKITKGRDRCEDFHRYPHDHQRATEKCGSSRHDSVDRIRSRHDQHSLSRNRHRSDRRDGSRDNNRRGKCDRNRMYRYESRDRWDNSLHKYNRRSAERSGRYSPSRDSGKSDKNPENEFSKNALAHRLSPRPSPTAVARSEMKAKGCDSDDEMLSGKENFTDNRFKLSAQSEQKHKRLRKKRKPARGDATFEISALRQHTSTPLMSGEKEKSSEFSFLKTLSQSNTPSDATSKGHVDSENAKNIDDALVNKVIGLPTQANTRVIPPGILMDVNAIKKALETAKIQRLFALEYNPEVATTPEIVIESQSHRPQLHHQTNSKNLQVTRLNDPRLSHARDPRLEIEQQCSSKQMPPISSSDVSPLPRSPYQAPSFAECNDRAERRQYEKSRSDRKRDYLERKMQPLPSTYGEYRASLQSNFSAEPQKLDRPANTSTSHHDRVHRSGNHKPKNLEHPPIRTQDFKKTSTIVTSLTSIAPGPVSTRDIMEIVNTAMSVDGGDSKEKLFKSTAGEKVALNNNYNSVDAKESASGGKKASPNKRQAKDSFEIEKKEAEEEDNEDEATTNVSADEGKEVESASIKRRLGNTDSDISDRNQSIKRVLRSREVIDAFDPMEDDELTATDGEMERDDDDDEGWRTCDTDESSDKNYGLGQTIARLRQSLANYTRK